MMCVTLCVCSLMWNDTTYLPAPHLCPTSPLPAQLPTYLERPRTVGAPKLPTYLRGDHRVGLRSLKKNETLGTIIGSRPPGVTGAYLPLRSVLRVNVIHSASNVMTSACISLVKSESGLQLQTLRSLLQTSISVVVNSQPASGQQLLSRCG